MIAVLTWAVIVAFAVWLLVMIVLGLSVMLEGTSDAVLDAVGPVFVFLAERPHVVGLSLIAALGYWLYSMSIYAT